MLAGATVVIRTCVERTVLHGKPMANGASREAALRPLCGLAARESRQNRPSACKLWPASESI